ncbi:MAG: hypothetical protein KF878_30335 [Planctomycetes bacterium]|nr:hypothetical protein [Planctomycetota bacterium]
MAALALASNGVLVSAGVDGVVRATARGGDLVGAVDLGPTGDLPVAVRVVPGADALLLGTNRGVVLEVEVLRLER